VIDKLLGSSQIWEPYSTALCSARGLRSAEGRLPPDSRRAILETASALVALDRRDLDAAWHRAHTALEAR